MTPPDELPSWATGTVTVLSTGGDGPPHAIPVSTAVRAGPRRIVLGLSRRRESLARLRQDPRCALTVLAEDVAITAHCTARIIQEPMDAADRMAAIELTVEAIQDHGQPDFHMDGGARWHWTDDEAARRDDALRAALAEL